MSDQGFILTRQQFDYPSGTILEFWLATDSGPVRLRTGEQESVFFIHRKQIRKASSVLNDERLRHRLQDVELHTFDHDPVSALYFQNSATAYQAKDLLKRHNIRCFEDDVRLADRFLMERFVYGSATFTGIQQSSSSVRNLVQGKMKPSRYEPKFTLLSIDIECSAEGELYSIGFAAREFKRVIMIGEPQGEEDWIEWVADERQLLHSFVRTTSEYDPDLFIGWNVVNFDFKLLIQRAELLGVPLKLGRGGEKARWRDGRETNQGFVSIAGRVVLDGIDGLKTATYQFDSFSLEFVAQALLGKGKETEDVDDRMATIERDFRHNKVKLANYNLQDCVLVLEIFEHTRLIDFLTLRSQLTGLELDRSGGSVAAFINLYLPKLHRAGYVSPNRPLGGGLASPGGYVMNSFPGLYDHVLVLDFKSLYPSIIRTFKIDPLGLVEGLANPDAAIPGFKGAQFDREQHFLPDIITSLWAQRDEAKKQKDSARSQAIKILMNSFYGVLGAGGCPFYDTRLASSITMRGHEIMQTTAAWIEELGHKVIYGDTDSTFVWLDGEVDNEKARQIGNALEQEINLRWQEKIQQEFQLTNYLEIEFETHFERFLMPTIRGSELGSKKRYAGLKSSPQGPQLVFKGLETVRSDWTELAKEFQQKLYAMVFADQDVSAYVSKMIEETRAGHFNDKLVYRKRLRQRLDKYVKNVPPHVKAARLADEKNQQLGKPLQYQHKGWISYVITTAGPEPLEHQTHPLDYEHYVDKQLAPIADGILPFIGKRFEELSSSQLGLF